MAAKVSTGPGTLDLEVYAGDANEVPIEFLAGGGPWDITGAVITAQARLTDLDPAVALEATAVVTDPPNGLASIFWDGEQVRALLAGKSTWIGVWDLQILATGSTLPRTMFRGVFTAVMDVTKVTAP